MDRRPSIFLVLLTLLLSLILCPYASANVTRIFKDHFFSASLCQPVGTDTLKLAGESITITFPLIETDYDSLKRAVDFQVVYTVDNTSQSSVEASLQFLGIDINEAQVVLNAERQPHTFVADPTIQKEFLMRIVEHRAQWNRERYAYFLSRTDSLRTETNRRPNHSTAYSVADLKAIAARITKLSDQFPDMQKFATVAFTARFKPGRNTLFVRYKQGLYVDARSSYTQGPIGRLGFDYLFYPAFTWQRDPSFRLDITVRLPDLVSKGWLWNSRVKPRYESNIGFQQGTYDTKARVTTLKTDLNGFPSPVFTFLLLLGLTDS